MPVFISHKREDSGEAAQVAAFLRSNMVRVYIDLLDPQLQETDDITALLLKRLADCTHLMAVVSGNTERSWWVPFEIGAATQSDRRISTFTRQPVLLPDYLSKWPILVSYDHLAKFVEAYKRDSQVIAFEEHAAVGRPARKTADLFHADLKRTIRGY